MNAPRKSVAVLVDHLYSYQISVLRGVLSGLSRQGVAAQVFLGRELGRGLRANGVYHLIHPTRHQGRVLVLQALSSHLTGQEWQEVLGCWEQLPTVSVATPIPGVPTVSIDQRTGILQMMDHLLAGGGIRHLVFLRGWPGNQDAQVREEAFRESLERHGFAPGQVRYLSGDFSAVKALQEMRQLLSQTRQLDAVVAANDEMALGALLALREQGIRVPRDVAVVGFDDTPGAALAVPPLTTVRQPTQEQGAEAARMLLAGLSQPGSASDTVLPSHLQVRQSCGRPSPAPTGQTLQERTLEQLFLRASRDPEQLDPFLKWWETVLPVRLQDQTVLQWWSERLDTLYQQARTADLPHLDRAYGQAVAAVLAALKMALFGAEMHQTLGARQAAQLDVGLQPSMERLLQDLRSYLDALEVQEGRLVLYPEPGPDLPQTGHLVMVQEKPDILPLEFPLAQLLPDSMQDELCRGHRVVFPLVVGERHHGLFIYRIDESNIADETPLQSIAHALHLVVQAREQERHLLELEKQVESRTRQLRQEIAERVGAEEQLKAAHLALQETAQRDGLTGLLRRAALDDRLERIFMEHQFTRQPVSLLLLDVDHFKLYNDHYGHRQGDSCLKEVATVLREAVRHERDVVARYGGEEFAVVLPATPLAGAELAAQRILQAIQARGLPHAASPVSPWVTLSIGVYTLTPRVDSVDAWVEGADQALYQAKKQGRNGYRVQAGT